jgi:hypothetical protein
MPRCMPEGEGPEPGLMLRVFESCQQTMRLQPEMLTNQMNDPGRTCSRRQKESADFRILVTQFSQVVRILDTLGSRS